jgi:hypothetical protein
MKLSVGFVSAALMAGQLGDVGAVEGRVVNAITGEPVRKAAVALIPMRSAPLPPGRQPPRPATVMSDAEGRFVFHAVPGGDYRVTAARPGFIDPSLSHYMLPLNLNPVEGVRRVEVHLTPLAVISGKILDEDGDPLRHATVQLARYRFAQGRRRLMPHGGGGSTNDRGEYRIFDVAPGKYYLVAHHNSVTPWGGSTEGYGTSYYPGTREPAQAGAIELAAGQELRDIDFRLPLEPLHKLRVRTIPADARAGVRINVQPLDSGMFRGVASSSSRQPDGATEYERLHAGRYRVTAHLLDETKGPLMAAQIVDIPAAGEVLLTLRPGVTLKGSVKMPPGPVRSPMQVSLEPVHSQDAAPVAAVAPDSSFVFAGIEPGEYRLRISTPPNTYLKTLRHNGEDRPGFLLDLSSGDAGTLALTLADDVGSLTGSVALPAGPIRPYTVVLAPMTPEGGARGLETRTQAEGTFVLPFVPPGEYLLVALDDLTPGASQDPEFAKQYENLGVRATVRPSSREKVERVPVIAGQP